MILRKMLTALWIILLVIYLLGFTVFWGGYVAGTPFARPGTSFPKRFFNAVVLGVLWPVWVPLEAFGVRVPLPHLNETGDDSNRPTPPKRTGPPQDPKPAN
jgi:hypothetical protein